ncbi:hypothetical protein CHS0354_041987 [Potamilus streckersoni]|uniref:Uncharacterized protein n=1 Tax=Potamilus streckersoni TaxID=2493646 RepID=A0AAE0T9R6_9BIVA|nr:hypothetical protein CHS0354_041987 [Potamilus streckersoni]
MASMSAVMKNLYTFANLLVQASTGAVSQWDVRSITNAYNWAAYCQKFYEVAKGKSFAVHLDRQIRSITLLLDLPGQLELNLERLKDATYILTKKILGNPATTDKLTFYIIERYRKAEDPQQIEELNKICRELSAEKDWKEEEQNTTSEIQEKQDHTVLVNTHAQILMECLHHQFLHTADMIRFDKYLKDMLQRICKGQHGWNIILKFLMLSIPLEMSEAQMLHIEKGLLQFLCDSSNDSRLWESDAYILAQLSSRYPQIGRSYLNHLISWSRTLETVYGKTELGTFYEWRYTGNSSMLTAEDQGKDSSGRGNHSKSFEALKKRLYILAQASVKTEELVLETLTDLSQSSYFNIWRDLLKKLFIT